MEFKLGQVEQVSKDYEKLKLVKNTEFARVVLGNMKVLYESRQRVLELKKLPESPEFLAYDIAVQELYDKHVLKDESGNVFSDNGQPKVKDPDALEAELLRLDGEHIIAKKELDDYQERVSKGYQDQTFILEELNLLSLPSDLDAVMLEVALRYVPQT